MPYRNHFLSPAKPGPVKRDRFSAIRVPREDSGEELSFAARNIEILRPQLPLIGLALACYSIFVVANNWPAISVAGLVWLAACLLVSLPLLLSDRMLTGRFHANPVTAVREISLCALAIGFFWGSEGGAFQFSLGAAASFTLVVIGLAMLAALPLAQMTFLAGFALGVVAFGGSAVPAPMVAIALFFSLAGIAASADVRFARAKISLAMNRGHISRLAEQKNKFEWSTNEAGELATGSQYAAQFLGIPRTASPKLLLWSLAGSDDAFDSNQSSENELAARILLRCHQAHTPFGDMVINLKAGDGLHRISMSGQPSYDSAGKFVGFRGAGVDLTEFSRTQERLLAAAERDALTKLMNRACFNENLEEQLKNWPAGGSAATLMLIDLDKFKLANDTFGHQVGDQVLRQFADRLRSFIGSDGYAGRLGGDEFGVVLPAIGSRAKLAALAGELIPFLSAPYEVSGVRVSIGATIGIATAPEHGDTVDALVRNADLALYTAKARGRNQYRFFDTTLLDHALERRRLESEFRKAFDNGELSVLYQPIVECGTDRLSGFEALVRWEHPVRGSVLPDEFIPIAEGSGLIGKLGEWVLREACVAAAKWPSHIRVAVNLSPSQFKSSTLTSSVVSSITESKIQPGRLELEITEGVFMEETPTMQEILQHLHHLGVRWTLDDFGTGYSSLKYLLKAPISKIKIDREFVNGLSVPGSQKRPIVQAIVALANSLQMETTAEGVESKSDLTVARELGCTQIQGFIYGPPLSLDEATSLTRSRVPIPAEGHDATRKEQRLAVLRSADIVHGEKVWPGTVRNISFSGAMIESEWRGSVGDRVEIQMDHEKTRYGIIRWVEGIRIGVEFERSSDAAAGEAEARSRRQLPSKAA